MLSARGDGTTTRQIQEAPKGAVYLWPHVRSLFYVQLLAQRLGRDDLECKSVHDVLEPTRVEKYASRKELKK